MIPVTLVTGFPGSGKTTFLLSALRRHEGKKIVCLINEPEEAVPQTLPVPELGVPVIHLSGHSFLDHSHLGAFLCELEELPKRHYAPDAPLRGLVIESSGMEDPGQLGSVLETCPVVGGYRLTRTILVLDPSTVMKLFVTFPALDRQIRSADVIILNNRTRQGPAAMDLVEGYLRQICAGIRLVRSDDGGADIPLFGDEM